MRWPGKVVRRARSVLAVFLFVMTPFGAGAVEPNELLSDPVLEARARVLSKNIRCLVCQNQSIDDSNASLARDLRIIVRERLVAGDSDNEIYAYLVARYGDYVLLKPPIKPSTYILWYGPIVIFGLGSLGAVAFLARRRRAARPEPLNAEETARFAKLMDEDEEAGS